MRAMRASRGIAVVSMAALVAMCWSLSAVAEEPAFRTAATATPTKKPIPPKEGVQKKSAYDVKSVAGFPSGRAAANEPMQPRSLPARCRVTKLATVSPRAGG